MGNISLNRINKLREACADAEIDAFFVRETSNVQWLSAFDGVFDEEGAHAMLVTPDGATLHTDSRYSEACKKAEMCIRDRNGADGRQRRLPFVRIQKRKTT